MYPDRTSPADARVHPSLPSSPVSAYGSHLLVLAVALIGLSAAAPASARAQARAVPTPAGAVRVVEVFDPVDGSRTHRPVADLTPSEIAAIQEALARTGRLGAWSGRLDGPTRAALRRFQREMELEPCGCPSYETLVTLGIETRVVQILVGASRGTERRGPSSGVTTAPPIPEVQIVYGTPPPRPPVTATDMAARGTEAGEPGARAGEREGPDGVSTAPTWDRRFSFDESHVLFPVFVGPPLFPFPPKPVVPDPGAREGLPWGVRAPGAPPDGIRTRSPPPRR